MRSIEPVLDVRSSPAWPPANRETACMLPPLVMGILLGVPLVAVAPDERLVSAWWRSESPRSVDRPARIAEGLSLRHHYERGKIPVILVHGLWGTERMWDRMIRDLESDEELRGRYQFWTFGYATGDSIPFSALRLRRAIRRARQALDPGGTDEAFDRIVVVGHSLGGLVAKMTARTTGLRLWETVSTKPLDRMSGAAVDVGLMREAFVYERLPEVRRLIFIATPHRGSPLARGVLGDLGNRICRATGGAGDIRRRLLSGNDAGFFGPAFRATPSTSVGELEPDSPLLAALIELGIDPAVDFHSIIASRGPGTGDGIVPLASARLDGVESELVVRAGHVCLEEREVIREAARILAEHAGIAARESCLRPSPSPDEEAKP